MNFKIVLLWTDVVVLGLLLALLFYTWHVRRKITLRAQWRKVFVQPAAFSAAMVLGVFLSVALLDSLHFRRALNVAPGQTTQAYSFQTESVLDLMLSRLWQGREESYSAPLASRGFNKVSQEVGGQTQRVQPRLRHGGANLMDDDREWGFDIFWRLGGGLLMALLLGSGVYFFARRPSVSTPVHELEADTTMPRHSREGGNPCVHDTPVSSHTEKLPTPIDSRLHRNDVDRIGAAQASPLPWRAAAITLLCLCLVIFPTVFLAWQYHVLGTDRTGNDVLYQTLKSIRTAFVIGTLSTLATLPLAVGLGLASGYFKGWVDELIQYLYTVLSSIPNVLLIAACVLMMQVFMDTHSELFETSAQRSDARLFLLCVILGLTGWAGLCRLLRAETLKLRELDYVQAARAFGVGPWRIMARHVFPNLVHLVIITTVLDFSALILYEAVLSYVGVGVDPSMNSFGGMINLARSEMSRDPLVWWPFASAFFAMVALVLAANLFADGVRDAFDPRAKFIRAKLKKSNAATEPISP
jgi:peptide/nickel transport system permease protein